MPHPDSFTYAQCEAIQASLRGLSRALVDRDREIHAATTMILYGSDAERATARTMLAERADLHERAAGMFCYVGTDGCCTLCGVEMTTCNLCHGVGYHLSYCRALTEPPIRDDMWFCQECTWAYSGVDSTITDEYRAKAVEDGQIRLNDLGRVAPNYEALESEGYQESSHHRCDCCGTTIGGTRHRHSLYK